MKKYAEYDFYVNEYGGTLPEEVFEKNIGKASAYIDYVTMRRITYSVLEKHKEDISLAACAVVEEYHSQSSGGELSSQTVGPWTRVYRASGKTPEQKLTDAVEHYLMFTGLLYRGACL